ncbi:FAD-binding protein [Aquabacterium fontiphilum]|nr:FAD-binding protein [Aquabacterium fontiphilum]
MGHGASVHAALAAVVGDQHVRLPDPAQSDALRPYLRDWRGRYEGRCLAWVQPANTAEVVDVVRVCATNGWPIVPQGGNTSLVGGAVPDDSGTQIVLHLGRLTHVRVLDAPNLSITVEAGCTLDAVREAARKAGLMFPLSLASGGSCTIGGNLATNAGGTQVLRYGTARELCLGLEVVTAQGDCWQQLQGLRKDNTGYALRDLMIGSEGTLGIITAATLRLFPMPRGEATALVSCRGLAEAVTLLHRARQALDAGLVAFEAMAPRALALVQAHLPAVTSALPAAASAGHHGWAVLIEHTSPHSQAHAGDTLAALLADALADSLIDDAVVAQSERQRAAMWALREGIPLAERTEGIMVKHDIGLPASRLADWSAETEQAIGRQWPQARVVCFGHLGDGNLHYNVQAPPAQAHGDAFRAFEQEVNRLVFDAVRAHGGTISAEHGIGVLRREELVRHRDPAAIAAMRAIKRALDPHNLLNPGRVLG